jgi:hypothetical protein
MWIGDPIRDVNIPSRKGRYLWLKAMKQIEKLYLIDRIVDACIGLIPMGILIWILT